MWLTNLAIKRPVVILMAFLALAVIGLKSKSGMRTDLYPKIEFPFVSIVTFYPGAGPQEIETLVSKPIEDAVGSVSGMKNLTSSSQESVSIIGIELELGTDVDAAMSDVRAKVDAARGSLPQDVDIPVIQKADVGAIPVLTLGMSSNRPAKELRELADDVIKDRLGKLKGVASVSITGGDIREIQVNVDKSRLEAYGLSIGQIAQGIAMGNLNLPSGRITEGRRDYAIRAVGEFNSPDEIRDLKLSFPGGSNGKKRVLTIGDIAQVKDTTAEREDLTRLQKKDSIGLQIIKQTDANTVEVVDAAKKELAAMKSILPKDVQIAIVFDQSDRVRESLDDVNMSLILGALLAVLIVFLFLHNIRGTLIVAIAIPMSIIATFIPISFAGFTLNMMVMMGLSLAVGILVDDSIVVLENIYRHLAKGESPAEAALNGRTEIGLAAITITMVDVVVFLPIAFMSGIVGMFFREFGITVASATLFSLIVSFTLTPMLASRWYRKGEALEAKTGFFLKFDQFYHALDGRYRRVLVWALGHRWQVVVAGFGALVVVNAVLGPMLGKDFFPRIDQGSVTAGIEMPAGTSLYATNAVATQIEDLAAKIPEATNVFTTVGSAGGGGFHVGTSGANFGAVTVALEVKESMSDRFMRPFMHGEKRRTRADEIIARDFRAQVASIPGAVIKVTVQSGMGGGESPIDIELTGGTDAERNAVAEKVKRAAAATPGVLNADLSWKVGKPEIKATIDRVRAAEMDLSVGQIASALRTSIAGNTDTRLRQNGKEYDIRVRLSEFDRYSLSNVGRTVIGSSDGQPVYLQDVAKITQDAGPTKIERKNRQRKISITGDVAPGSNLQGVRVAIDKNLEKVDLGNVHLHWGGQVEMMGESYGNMGGALLLSIALVYMLMAALFESLLNPFVIMFSIPMALVGAIIALVLAGENMSIVSMIGIIMLMGLVTKNAILLIDYTNTLRARGKDRNEAILEAGPTRLRPILMTTFAMIFGMLPTAMKLGRGSEMRAPMAIAVIGGLIVSTLLTLVIIPVTYTYVDDLQNKFISWKQQIFGHRIDDETPEPESEF